MNKNISFGYGYVSAYTERIAMLTDVGFDGVLVYAEEDLPLYIEKLAGSGLRIEALHLPYKSANALWIPDDGSGYIKQLLAAISIAARFGIEKVVMHVTSGYQPPEFSTIGISRLKQLLDRCRVANIHLCLENLKRIDYLELIFEQLNDPLLKFCFDSGHASAFSRNLNTFPWNRLNTYLDCVHLHDNDGLSDHHWLPFDGNIDWHPLMNDLYGYHRGLELTLELHQQAKEKYQLTEIDFLHLAYSRLLKLESLIKY